MILFPPAIHWMTPLALAISLAAAQEPLIDRAPRSGAKPAVEYLFPEQVSVTADKPATVALHFRVAPGLHINAHVPKDADLIPTSFSIPDDSGVRLLAAEYPAGAAFTLPLDPATKLIVYTGEFVVQARINAEAGGHLVVGKLRYQACDNNACMPPQSIPVAIDVIAK